MGANKQKQGGFILATTLWMMAIVTVLATLFHGYVETQLERAAVVRQQMQDQLDMLNTGSTVYYLLATRRVTLGGLTLSRAAQLDFIDEEGIVQLAPLGGELRLDGSRYRGIGNASFSIQDQAGLFSANSPSAPSALAQVLANGAGSQRARELSAALADYIDENPAKRLNGAEAPEYSSRGLAPPSNYQMPCTTPM
jgi:general secretion pathway protein K